MSISTGISRRVSVHNVVTGWQFIFCFRIEQPFQVINWHSIYIYIHCGIACTNVLQQTFNTDALVVT